MNAENVIFQSFSYLEALKVDYNLGLVLLLLIHLTKRSKKKQYKEHYL